MPIIPCDECKMTFTNMVQLKRHKLSGTCEGHQKSLEEGRKLLNREEYKFDFFNNGRAGSIEPFAWRVAGLEGGHHSPGGLGSLGVYFLNMKNNDGVVVFKAGTGETPCDVYCTMLFQSMGVSCPTMRLLPKDEHRELMASLKELPFTAVGAADKLQEQRSLAAGGLLMTFQQGFTLKDPRAAAMLKGPGGHVLLESIGGIVALDMLVNNFDRSPFIWDHEGNANNLMFTEDCDQVHAIDNTTAAVVDASGIERYTDRVVSGLKEALEGNTSGPHTAKLVKYIETWTGLTLSEAKKCKLQVGMVSMATRICTADLMAPWQELAAALSGETSLPNASESSVDVSFVSTVQQAFQRAFGKE